MSNIIKELKDRNITSQIRYYGKNDMASGFEIKNIVDNYDLYNELIDSIKPTIKSSDDYINYLYIRCLKEYREILDIVRDDLKEKIEAFITKIESLFQQYNEGDLAKFIISNYKKVLSNDYEGLYIKHDVIEYTIEYMCKYCSNNKKAIEYIIKNYSYIVYDNFDSFKKMFDNSDDLYYYDLLLTSEKLQKDSVFRLEEIKKVLLHLKEKNESKYNDKVDILVKIFKEETFNASTDDIMNKHFKLSDFIKILSQLKHPSCREFEIEFKKQEKIMDEYMREKGHEQVFSIDIKPVIEIMEKKETEWYIKSLSMTHTKKGKKLISIFESIIEKSGKKGIVDFATSNIETDDTFTYTTINALSIGLLHGKHILNYMISDNSRLNDLLAYIMIGLDNYFKDESIYFDREKFELDINMIFDAIKELNEAYREKNDIKIKRIIYGLEVQLCGVIEKTLRVIYRELIKEQEYIPFDSVSLTSLLDQSALQKELGQGNCQCIQYLLGKRAGNISKNTRNDFTHYNDEIYDKLNLDTVLEALYILLVISNTLLCMQNN